MIGRAGEPEDRLVLDAEKLNEVLDEAIRSSSFTKSDREKEDERIEASGLDGEELFLTFVGMSKGCFFKIILFGELDCDIDCIDGER